ncbi:MAG: permease-like cell division protein FtsX [Actinomycetes bacterium]
MRVQFVLKEIGIGLRRNLTMTVAVVVTVAVSLAMVGAGLLIRAQVAEMKGFWYERVEVTISLCNEFDASTNPACVSGEVSDSQRSQIEADLKELDEVQQVFYESKEQAYQLFQEEFADNAIRNTVTPDQLPESFRVKLVDPEEFAVIASAFEGRPGVESVVDQKKVLDPFFKFLNGLTLATATVAGLVLIAAVLLVVNTIRVAAFSRRRETGIMRLVGASNFYIQVPFLLEGAIAGLLGAVVAAGLLVATYYFLVLGVFKPDFAFVNSWVGWDTVLTIVPVLLVLGMVISALASFFTLRRYLRV